MYEEAPLDSMRRLVLLTGACGLLVAALSPIVARKQQFCDVSWVSWGLLIDVMATIELVRRDVGGYPRDPRDARESLLAGDYAQ